MDNKVMNQLSYGVFLLATEAGGKKNACIINTCTQVASNPLRVAVSVINANYTCDLIKESGKFSVSILDQSIPFDTIKYFGMQSGRDVDKLGQLPCPTDVQGVPYLGWANCGVLSCKVVSSQDLGTHTLFIAEVVDGKVLSEGKPLTYAYYHSDVKPQPAKPAPEKKIIGWRCRICKYVYEGAELPADFVCPLCGHGPEDFEPIYAE